MNVLVTGGAGFIGSQLCLALTKQGADVVVLDNLSEGDPVSLKLATRGGKGSCRLSVGDCKNEKDVRKAMKGIDVVYHLAANPEVRLELCDPKRCFQENVYATFTMLEEFRRSEAEVLVFASSSTVYGEARTLPTPETYSPMEPISLYGASKLACEALVGSYAHSFDKKAVILRLANVIGPRSTHGVIVDFARKLASNRRELEILGDGRQSKSYIHVADCVEAFLKVADSEDQVSIFNVGSTDKIEVRRIAQVVLEELGITGTTLKYVSKAGGGRGWVGDVKSMLLDITKLESTGWRPRHNSEEAVRLTARSLDSTGRVIP